MNYRIEENESLIKDLETASDAFVVIVELLHDLLGSFLWKFDEETLRRLNVIGSYEDAGVV